MLAGKPHRDGKAMDDRYLLRDIGIDDLNLICRHRHEMFKASGRRDEDVQPMTESFRLWVEPRLKTGAYFGWIVTDEAKPVAGVGMMVIDWPPHPLHPQQDRRGYVLNVFVEPDHRGRGLARHLMAIVRQEAARRGLRYLVLHSTKMGRALYEKLGWQQTSEMGLAL